MPVPPVALNWYVEPAKQPLMVLYSPPYAQVVMVTGVLVVGAVIVPKALGLLHCAEAPVKAPNQENSARSQGNASNLIW